MTCQGTFFTGAWVLLASGMLSLAGTNVLVEHHTPDSADGSFAFAAVPRPSVNDAAAAAKFTLVDGRRDENGGALEVLHDGKVPLEEDAPARNFFFGPGMDGGRILVDLGHAIEMKQVNTYSWHPGARGPQVYQLYASDGRAPGFIAEPKRGTDPTTCGWALLARVDTRPKEGEEGGQYGVSISDPRGSFGGYRYLLFDIFRTGGADRFANTFFSEIDVLDAHGPAPLAVESPAAQTGVETVETEDGRYQISIDTSETPDLTEWARQELVPVVREWYPRIVRLLPSEGFEAPRRVSIAISKEMEGVAATGGARIRCAAKWIRQNLYGEAKGSIFHELVHVVQQYGRAPRGSARAPGWLTEGIADYLRWYHFEPEARGAEITRQGLARARYDGSYRTTANFLDWAKRTYDQDLVRHLNAALRRGQYNEDLWKQRTGHSAPALGDEWKRSLEQKLGAEATPGIR